jgi:hypothetical protein
MRTLERLANAVNLEIDWGVNPVLTREDRRSLAYHRVVADKLHRDPRGTLKRATSNLSKLRRIHPNAGGLFKRWESWLRLPHDTLAKLLVARDEAACDMRQVSPFSGLLSPAERAEILRQFREEWLA